MLWFTVYHKLKQSLRWTNRTNTVFSLSNMSSNGILSSLGRTTFSVDHEFKEFLIRSPFLQGAFKIVLAYQRMFRPVLIQRKDIRLKQTLKQ